MASKLETGEDVETDDELGEAKDADEFEDDAELFLHMFDDKPSISAIRNLLPLLFELPDTIEFGIPDA